MVDNTGSIGRFQDDFDRGDANLSNWTIDIPAWWRARSWTPTLGDVGIGQYPRRSGPINLVYFSSASENTHRFVQKLGLPATRIPLRDKESTFEVQDPYVLICPTYGGGHTPMGPDTRFVPKQVIRFLNNEHNRSLIRGVIAAGNTNFGDSYCAAGDVIARKCQVPYLYRFELLGSPEDIERVREGLAEFWQHHPTTQERTQ